MNVPVTREPWPADRHGQDEKTALNMAKYIAVGAHSPGIRGRMSEALDAAGIPRSERPGVRACAQAARAWVKENTRYASDPVLAELIQDPRITACTDDAPGGVCIPLEDCDGQSVLVLAMLASIGIEVCIFLLDYGPGHQPHVLGGVKDETGQWLDVDTTTERRVGERAWARSRRRINPFDPKVVPLGHARAEYVGVGKALDVRVIGMGEAIFGHAVGAAAPPPATSTQQLASDLSAFYATAAAGDTYMAAGELDNAVEAYKAAGNAGAGHVGPDLDAVTNGASQPSTQSAWQINAALNQTNSTPFNNIAATAADAEGARQQVRQMAALYGKELERAGLSPRPPVNGWVIAAWSALGVAGLSGLAWGVHRLGWW